VSKLTDSVVKHHVYFWTTGKCSCGELMPSNYHYSYHVAECVETWMELLMNQHRFESVEKIFDMATSFEPYKEK
jgi:hypothetical protein